MPDEVTAPQVQPDDTSAPPEQPTATDPDPLAEVEKWKALARKHEQRAKENADARRRLDEIEEASKSEAQKLADKLSAAEQRAIQAERKAFASEKGVPVSLITGDTPEQWEAAAEQALAWRGDVKPPPAVPRADGQGAVGAPIGGPEQITSRDVLKSMSPDEIVKAKAEGRLNTLLGIK